MHIVVFGVGAIGGFYGTLIANYLTKNNLSQPRLSFIARGKILEELKSHGSKLICKKASFGEMQETIILVPELRVFDSYSKVTIDPNELTVVLLCTKSKDTTPCAMAIKRNFNQNTVVVSIQNGVDNEEKIAKVLGERCVIGCLTNVAAETLEPGIYLQKGNYGLLLGELDGNQAASFNGTERLEILKNFFEEAGINVRITETILKDQWSKLVWNAAFNPLSVLHEYTVGQILADQEIKKRLIAVMQETFQVAKAQGIDIADDVVEKHIERTSAPDWYDFRTSMLQDYQKGSPIEINELLGIVVERGKQLGLKTPESASLLADVSKKLSLRA